MSTKWVGTDVDLETSLFEYGFIAKQKANKDHEDEWFVLYKILGSRFDSGHVREKDLDDLINGKDWMNDEDIKSFLDFVGMTKEIWLTSPFVCKLSDMLIYWGYQNIMGDTYYPIDEDTARKMMKEE